MKSGKLHWVFILLVLMMPGVLGLSCNFGGYYIPCDSFSTLGWGIIAGVGIIILLVTIFWWVMFIDSIRRDLDRKALWIIFLLIGGLLGAIIYYFAVRRKGNRKSKKPEKISPAIKPRETIPAIESKTAPEIPPVTTPRVPQGHPPVSYQKPSQTSLGKPNLQSIKEQLIRYREAALAKGYTKEQIKQTFLTKGYPMSLINEVLGSI